MGGGLARPQLLRLGMFGIVVLIHLQYILAPNENQGFINIHTQHLVHGHQLAPADTAGFPVFRRVIGYTPCSELFGFTGDRDTGLAGPVRNKFRRQSICTAKKKLHIAVAQNFLPLVVGIAVLKAS